MQGSRRNGVTGAMGVMDGGMNGGTWGRQQWEQQMK